MKTIIIKYFLGIALLLLAACVREPIAPTPPAVTTIHYSATVSEDSGTRASLNSNSQYVFSDGDKLYIADKETGGSNMHGFLTLSDGVGNPTANFEGDLTLKDGYYPAYDTGVSVTLIGATDKIHTITDNIVSSNLTYPSSGEFAFATSFANAVQKFSHFTDDNHTFGEASFTLSQHSSFLRFIITLQSGANTTVSATITANGTTLRQGDIEASVQDNGYRRVEFYAAFKGGDNLKNAKITVQPENEEAISPFVFTDDNGTTLAENNYYTISRTTIPFVPFTIKARENGTSITFKRTAGNAIQYKKNDGEWTDYTAAISLSANDELSFRGKGTSYDNGVNNTDNKNPLFSTNRNVYIFGDLMSLMMSGDYEAPKTVVEEAAFRGAFRGISKLDIDPDREFTISATTLAPHCYQNLFRSCSGLTRVLALPATDLSGAEYCYAEMFRQCSNLKVVPSLPATTLSEMCYQMMFSQSGIENVPSNLLPATELAVNCYRTMFSNCSLLTNAPDLPATTLVQECYFQMFYNCPNLTKAPDLPATTLVSKCYQEMFMNCTNLNYIKCLATQGINVSSSSSNWVKGVTTSSGTFVKAALATNWQSGNNGIPSSWTVQDAQ